MVEPEVQRVADLLRGQGVSILHAKRTLMRRFPMLEATEALQALDYIPEPGLWIYKKMPSTVFGEGTSI